MMQTSWQPQVQLSSPPPLCPGLQPIQHTHARLNSVTHTHTHNTHTHTLHTHTHTHTTHTHLHRFLFGRLFSWCRFLGNLRDMLLNLLLFTVLKKLLNSFLCLLTALFRLRIERNLSLSQYAMQYPILTTFFIISCSVFCEDF